MFLAFAGLAPLAAAELTGRVVKVSDGDTVTVLIEERDGPRPLRVRLAEIDAPESGQAYGAWSKRRLSDLVAGRYVEVEPVEEDRYGRTVGYVRLDGRDVGRVMVAQGAAWAYRRYLKDQDLLRLEEAARNEGLGLWSPAGPAPVEPWLWRRGGEPRVASEASRPVDRACGVKRYCGQMASCSEARFYLLSCGLRRLDGDRDGVPCEQLCRR